MNSSNSKAYALPSPPLLRRDFVNRLEQVLDIDENPVVLDAKLEMTRNQIADRLVRLEYLIEAALADVSSFQTEQLTLDKEAAFRSSEYMTRYYGWMPDFLLIVQWLVAKKVICNGNLQAFIDTIREFGIADPQEWKGLQPGPVNAYSPADYRGVEVFFRLLSKIRQICLNKKNRSLVCKRRYDARKLHHEYREYLAGIVACHSRVVVLRVDFSYREGLGKEDATRARRDFDKFLNLARHNQLFRGWLGYVARLEYGVKSGWHWHVLIVLNGHERDGRAHIKLAADFGELWIKTAGHGSNYWNCNANERVYATWGCLGIGDIRYSDLSKLDNLYDRVLPYLTSGSQLMRLGVDDGGKSIRRGLSINSAAESKLGRPRKR